MSLRRTLSEDLKHAFRRSAATEVGSVDKSLAGNASDVSRPRFVSVRVTEDEKARLQRDAAGLSLSDHIRERLLGDDVRPRRTRSRFPVKDHEALARVLSKLGRSALHNTLHRLLLAVEEQRIPLERPIEDDLRQAFADINAMRNDLVTALGLKTGRP